MENSVIDLIIRIKNGYLARLETIDSPHSIFREKILLKLVALKFIKDFTVEGRNIKNIKIKLRYNNGAPAITDVEIFSKPGRRYYIANKKIKPVLSGLGFSILSTSKGILTDKEAQKEKLGGELLFNIW